MQPESTFHKNKFEIAIWIVKLQIVILKKKKS